MKFKLLSEKSILSSWDSRSGPNQIRDLGQVTWRREMHRVLNYVISEDFHCESIWILCNQHACLLCHFAASEVKDSCQECCELGGDGLYHEISCLTPPILPLGRWPTPYLKPWIFTSLISACKFNTVASDQMLTLTTGRAGGDPKVLSSLLMAPRLLRVWRE